MKRIWHNYLKWEDLEMWRKVSAQEEAVYLQKAIEFTGDYKLYGSWMKRVIETHKFACEHNFTNSGMNKRAWLGHAAVQMAIGCPEYITRQAWKHLSIQQQNDANEQANIYIKQWMEQQSKQVYNNVEAA